MTNEENELAEGSIRLTAEFENTSSLNISALLGALLTQGLLINRISILVSRKAMLNPNNNTIYSFKCTCGFHFGTIHSDLFDEILEQHEDCDPTTNFDDQGAAFSVLPASS